VGALARRQRRHRDRRAARDRRRRPGRRPRAARLQREHERLPPTLRARSARGEHLYFSADAARIGNSAGQLGAGLDVRGRGGYVVAPPSRHASGKHYRWTSAPPPAPLPAWLAALLAPPPRVPRTPLPIAAADPAAPRARRYFDTAVTRELEQVARARPGTRNDTLNRAAFRLGQLAGAGLTACDALVDALLHAARSAGLGDTEAKPTIASGLGAGERHPRRLTNTPRP
jgi:hypothetical protein